MSDTDVYTRRKVTVSKRLMSIAGKTRWVHAEEGNERMEVDTPADGHCYLTGKELREWALFYKTAADALDEAEALRGLADKMQPAAD